MARHALLWLNVACVGLSLLQGSPQQSFLAAKTEESTSKDSSKAREILNQMYVDSITELDLLKLNCDQSLDFMQEQLAVSERRMSDFGADAASARAGIAQAQQRQDEALVAATSLRLEAQKRLESCRMSHASRLEQRDILLEDVKGAKGMQESAHCEDAAALLECEAHDGKKFLAIGGTEGTVSKLSPEAREVADRALRHSTKHASKHVEKKGHHEHHEKALLQVSEEKCPVVEYGKNSCSTFTCEDIKAKGWCACQNCASMLDKCSAECPAPVAEVYPTASSRTKCSVSGSASCPQLHDALAQMVGEAEDALAYLDAELGLAERQCAALQKESEVQQQSWELKHQQGMVDMAKATAKMNEDQQSAGMGQKEQEELVEQQKSAILECANKEKMISETLCGVQTMRMNLMEMSNEEVQIQDCEVGEWVRGPCSEECGGGEMTLSREVLTPAINGATCPPLSMVVSCNRGPCPIDCEVGEWSEWSDCSKDCGGGVHMRGRLTRTEAEHGGVPCPAIQDQEMCNLSPCEQPCQYGEWSELSSCTQQCGGGWQTRTRPIVQEALGSEHECVGIYDHERLQPQMCNEHVCPEGLECQTEMDLVILMDGSGSVVQADLDAQKAGVKALLDRIGFGEGLAQVGLAVFGGDVKELHPLSADKAATVASVDNAALNADQSTHLSMALEHANTMLANGRIHASSTIVVFLEGMPTDGRAAAEVVKHINARVVVVPVGGGMDMTRVVTWGSFPAKLNALAVKDFAALAEDVEVTRMIGNLCPQAEVAEVV